MVLKFEDVRLISLLVAMHDCMFHINTVKYQEEEDYSHLPQNYFLAFSGKFPYEET